jgi:acetate kinase
MMDLIEDFPTHDAAIRFLLTSVMEDNQLPKPDGVGHRVVHGGPDHTAHEVVTGELVGTLRRLIPFAPLHLPPEIRGIDAVTRQFPELGQVVCFDTAFHRSMPEVARRFPLPRSLWHEGVYRYGFHGLSYEYVVHKLGDQARGRHVIAHLGNGASMTALRDGLSEDTTMGFTPTAGLMMGTRCGDIDPGLLVYLMEEKDYDAGQLSRLLNYRSGLIGVSGISSDMKTLLARRAKDDHAAMAVAMFCYRARKAVGGLAAVLDGLDGLVFTGGIGERAAPVREMICAGLGYLGIRLDAERNAAHAEIISAQSSPCTVRVVPTNEDLVIARHTRHLLFSRDDV